MRCILSISSATCIFTLCLCCPLLPVVNLGAGGHAGVCRAGARGRTQTDRAAQAGSKDKRLHPLQHQQDACTALGRSISRAPGSGRPAAAARTNKIAIALHTIVFWGRPIGARPKGAWCGYQNHTTPMACTRTRPANRRVTLSTCVPLTSGLGLHRSVFCCQPL